MKKIVIALVLILVLTACAAPSKQAESTEQTGKEEVAEGMKNKGIIAPDFTLKDMDGNEISLSALKGKKVYLKFWASWCHFCIAGMPDLETLVQSERDYEIYTIVAPGINRELSEEDFKQWYDQQGFSKDIKVLFDTDGSVMRNYGISGYPSNGFIGTDGVLTAIIPGLADNNIINEKMAALQ